MSFKKFDLTNDVASNVSGINETLAVSGSIYVLDDNVKRFDNIASGSSAVSLGGYWKTVYDASPTSSLSTPIMDLTYGIATGSAYNTGGVTSAQSLNEKIKMYRHFAGSLLGDCDALFNINGADVNEAFFIVFKRNIIRTS